jgi:hypothetical protein
MKNLLKEEVNNIKYLFGYKKGVVISEQDELGSAPEQLFTYVNGQKELNTAFLGGGGEVGKFVGTEVKEWCKKNDIKYNYYNNLWDNIYSCYRYLELQGRDTQKEL